MVSNFNSLHLHLISYPMRPRKSYKHVLSKPCQKWPIVMFQDQKTWLSTSQLNLCIYFHSVQVCDSFCFYHSFSYRGETFSVHFVARFITQRHFIGIYACSEPCVCCIHSFPWHVHHDLSVCCSTGRLWSRYTHVSKDWLIVQYERFAVSWTQTLGHEGVTASYKLQTTPLSSYTLLLPIIIAVALL